MQWRSPWTFAGSGRQLGRCSACWTSLKQKPTNEMMWYIKLSSQSEVTDVRRLGFLGAGEDDTVVLGLEPLHGVLLAEAVLAPNIPGLPPPSQNIHQLSSRHLIKWRISPKKTGIKKTIPGKTDAFSRRCSHITIICVGIRTALIIKSVPVISDACYHQRSPEPRFSLNGGISRRFSSSGSYFLNINQLILKQFWQKFSTVWGMHINTHNFTFSNPSWSCKGY